jgi:UDP-GlcNAc3NAcA epimerase
MNLTPYKWISVVGARPQFVKLAPICRAIETHNAGAVAPQIEHVIVHTGQHYDREVAELLFIQMAIPEPKHNLGVGSGSFGTQLARMIERLEPVLDEERPDFVIVYGDTNSTLAGAIVASRMNLRLAHVEAGCRSYDLRTPEEQNRIVTDQLSELLFVPSQNAIENLHREGLGASTDPAARRVINVGDVMYDALLHNRRLAQRAAAANLRDLGLKQRAYDLLTIHRAENTNDTQRLRAILDAVGSLDLPVLFPVHPRTKHILAQNEIGLPANVVAIPPAGFLEMLGFEESARIILTDSGGVQKEAFYLGVPCITLRDRTEWPETVDLGANRIAGTTKNSILAAIHESFGGKREPGSPYGDGHAAIKIVQELLAASEGSNRVANEMTSAKA